MQIKIIWKTLFDLFLLLKTKNCFVFLFYFCYLKLVEDLKLRRIKKLKLYKVEEHD